MPNKKYFIEPLEVEGRFAMFTNPSTGSAPTSFPFPTPTALKGLVETICYVPQVIFRVTELHVCKPVEYAEFGFNSTVSHLKKDEHISKDNLTDGNTLQRRLTVLRDVVYHVFGYFENLSEFEIRNIRIPEKYSRTNHAHAVQEIFNRRLKRGSYTHPPFLGNKKFSCSYSGPIRRNEEGKQLYSPCPDVNVVIPFMPKSVFDKVQLGTRVEPSFIQNVRAINGVVDFESQMNAGNSAKEIVNA